MKLREEFVTHMLGDTQVMVATGSSDFAGIVRSNESAAFLVDQLKADTTREGLINAMSAEYDGTPEQIEHAVDYVLEKLRSIDALEE